MFKAQVRCIQILLPGLAKCGAGACQLFGIISFLDPGLANWRQALAQVNHRLRI